MVNLVTLENKTRISDPSTIIAFIFRKFCRNMKDSIPILDDEIISLKWLCAKYSKDVNGLSEQIRSSLQRVLNRVFNGEREITVVTNYTVSSAGVAEITISITYVSDSKDLVQVGTSIYLNERNELVLAEDSITPVGLDLFRILG